MIAQASDAVLTGGAVALALAALELVKLLLTRLNGRNNKDSVRAALQDQRDADLLIEISGCQKRITHTLEVMESTHSRQLDLIVQLKTLIEGRMSST